MDGTGVCTARNHNIPLTRNFAFLSKVFEDFYNLWVTNDRAVHHLDGHAASQHRAPLLLVLKLPSHGNIYGDPVVRINGVGGGFAPPQPQLFLDGEDKIQVAGIGPNVAQRVQHHSAKQHRKRP